MPLRSRGQRACGSAARAGLFLCLALGVAACGGSGGPDLQTLVVGGTKAREGVGGGGGATVSNTLILGDTPGNAARVAFLSFPLTDLPAGADVATATLHVHHMGVTFGSPYPDLGVLVVDSVDLGAGVDASDATSPALITLPGTLSDAAAVGARSLDVTAAVLADLAALRTRSEFRLRFTLGTDDDGQQDTIQIAETGSVDPQPPPTLVITYRP